MRNKLLQIIFIIALINEASGQHFVTVGSGVDCPGVRGFAIDTSNNLLYLCGDFVTVNGITARGVASFDGVNAHALNIGMDSGWGTCAGPVDGIGLYHNNLIAGGAWITVDTLPITQLAQWNGIHWDSVPGWIHWGGSNVPFRFLVHNNDLYIAGNFSKQGNNLSCVDLAKWDGAIWTGFTTGIGGTGTGIVALCVYDNKVYYGGYFLGASNSINNLGYLDSIGVHDAGFTGYYVNALAVYHNELYVGGYFFTSQGCAGNYIMRWDGTAWYDVGGGMSGAGNSEVQCLAVYNDYLYAGGFFTYAGGVLSPGIASWDGVSWHALNTDSILVYDMAFYKNELYVAADYRYKFFAKYTGVLPSGINENSATLSSFSLSPNPATNQLAISSRPPDKSGAIRSIFIYDVLGQTVSSFSLAKDEVKKEIDISWLAKGVYFVVLQTEEGRVAGRFIKE